MKVVIVFLLILSMTIPASATELTAPEPPADVMELMPAQPDNFGEGLLYILKNAIRYLEPSLADASGVCCSLIAIALLLYKIPFLSRISLRSGVAAAANAVLIVALMVYAFGASSNTYLLGTAKEDLPQYRFAEKMQEVESPTLLNYGFLDGGFYFAADILPSSPYFCQLNLITEEQDQAMRQQVENGMVDFVVTQEMKLEDCGLKVCPYTLVDSADMVLEGDTYTYRLYQKIN
jgi:hypothetical protein